MIKVSIPIMNKKKHKETASIISIAHSLESGSFLSQKLVCYTWNLKIDHLLIQYQISDLQIGYKNLNYINFSIYFKIR